MSVTPKLALVMPVYNEEASVRKVVREWFEEVSCWEENFLFFAVNDGSTDRTPSILAQLGDQLGSRFQVLSKPNSGHGQTCLYGYREAATRKVEWIFQLDSDGQCDPQFFHRLWRLRGEADLIYGFRKRRDDGFRRVVASAILRWGMLLRFGLWIPDANVPYRLLRTATVMPLVEKIPPSLDLANIALAFLGARTCLPTRHVPICFRERYGGEPKVRMNRFAVKAIELFKGLKHL